MDEKEKTTKLNYIKYSIDYLSSQTIDKFLKNKGEDAKW